MKKKQIFLKTIVAITLLSAMLVSAFLGTSNAEYFKSFKKTLSLEMKPDLNLSYYLYDADRHTDDSNTKEVDESKSYKGEYGTYKNAGNFVQKIVVGLLDADKVTINSKSYHSGKSIVYQVKVPVDETGYYNIDFTTCFRVGSSIDTTYESLSGDKRYDFYTLNLDYPVGCEVLTASDNAHFGEDSTKNPVRYDLNMDFRTYKADTIQGYKNNQTMLYADSAVLGSSDTVIKDSVYQWKTLAPMWEERVSLTFKAQDADVARGYVIWAWDLSGLEGGHNYQLHIDSLEIKKIMNLDGTTDTRDSSDPYFMFPQTAYVNNVYVGTEGSSSNNLGSGFNRYSPGRGTYITSATTNSLAMRAEMLYKYNSTNDTKTATDNPLTLYVPVKNIYADRTYKVTFDLSIAKQGSSSPNDAVKVGYLEGAKKNANGNWHTYSSNIFYNDKSLYNKGAYFRSYLHQGIAAANSHELHNDGLEQIDYADKYYQNKPLTKYDELTSLSETGSSANTNIKYTSVLNVNDTYSQSNPQNNYIDKSSTRNWFNAVRHTEYEGQYEIPWVTFYNTTFSFNIDSTKNTGLTIDETTKLVENLYWVWNIDALHYKGFYNIRIENVRIQEVVQYGSSLDRNGVTIAGVQATLQNSGSNFIEDEDDVNGLKGLFVSFRGQNGTGQNYRAKGFVLNNENETDINKKTFTSEMNIYAPIIDARLFNVSPNDANYYKIALDGYAVCEGGIDRYVFSVDGGNTWHDMTLENIDTSAANADSTQLSGAAKSVDQFVSGQTRYELTKQDCINKGKHQNLSFEAMGADASKFTFADFTSDDAKNANFDGWKLTADLSDFKQLPNLDVIIAAVPEKNQDFRCEILRIINYNQIQQYYTHAQNIVSDIKVTNATSTIGESQLNAFYYPASSTKDNCENSKNFAIMRGYRADGTGAHFQIGAYTNKLLGFKNYEDVPSFFSDIPVYTKLSITGWAVAEKGIESFYWTVDGGKTWNPCVNDDSADAERDDVKEIDLDTTKEATTTIRERLVAWWTNGSEYKAAGDTKDQKEAANAKVIDKIFYFHEWASATDTFTGYIQADLSAYEGQVVDVLFAAKPNQSDVYVPVAKVDNVAVYGEQGTFYTRVHRVIIDGRTNEEPSGDKNITVPTQTFKDSSGTKLNYQDKWNIGYSDQAYVIFEPQNVNAANSRYLFNDVKEIESGGRVAIDGYIMCKGGVSRYKFSLDGGETWTEINDFGTNIPADAKANGTVTPNYEMFKNCKKSDASFNLAKDGEKGNFCCTGMDKEGATTYNSTTDNDENRKAFYDHALEFNIPALPEGTERDLLVVAEHDPDGNRVTDDGKEFPVLHMKIRVKNTQYGYQNIANKANFSTIQAGYTTNNRSWEFDPAFSDVVGVNNNTLNRITIPVTETGEHTITFDHTISNPAVTKTETKRQLYNNDANAQSGRYTDITLSVPKTHFAYGEAIKVDFTCAFNKDTAVANRNGYGTLKLAIISNDWRNQNKEQHAIRSQVYTPKIADGSLDKVSFKVDDIRKLSYENAGLTESSKEFKAGSYSILLLHRAPGELSNILITQKYRDAFILAEIPIYIHEEGVEFSAVHDEGKYTYFSDVSRQLTAGDDNVYTIATLSAAELFYTSGTVAKTITATVNVTEGDVRRGYIVLDTNYTGLWAGNKHTDDECTKDPSEGGYGEAWGEHEYDANCTIKEHKHDEDPHYAEHTHDDDRCLSRNPGNGSTFYKILPGKELRQIWNNGKVVSTMKHPGITYTVNISFDANAFIKKN